MSEKCESCRRGLDGRNGNGYSPCGCKSKDNLSDADLLRQVHEAIEPRPFYVKPPPLMPIGQPRLGWKPKHSSPDPYANINKFLLIVLAVCLVVMGFVSGCLYATSHIS